MWVRADLRRRWRSWVVLGILAGVTAGLAGAAVAGARRTAHLVPTYMTRSHVPDAAVLPNDRKFDAAKQAQVANLPEVRETYPFVVAFELSIKESGLDAGLVPAAARTMTGPGEPIVAGRLPDPARADEMVIDENSRKEQHLRIGSTLHVVQEDGKINQAVRVIGITNSTSSDISVMLSSGFYDKYQKVLFGITNEFVDLRNDAADLPQFRTDVNRILGHPVNTESGSELFGIRQETDISHVERDGLLLFALGVVLAGFALVGQALVRSVSAGASDLGTWRAIGADRSIASTAMVMPALLAAAVGAVTSIVVAILLSPRFPIAHIRRFDTDIGFHADWTVLVLTALAAALAVGLAAWATAEVRVRRGQRARANPSFLTKATNVDMPASLLIGSRLATEPGQGRRAVPIRSAFIGAIVGVLGFVGCLTFRAGLSDVVANPQRTGIVWDYVVASGDGPVALKDLTAIANDPAVGDVLHALWARAIPVQTPKGNPPVSVFGTESTRGDIKLVVLDGRAPSGADEIAFAPTTMRELGLHVGSVIHVGANRRQVTVVGKALLPATSHTEYDQSGWMTAQGLAPDMPASKAGDVAGEDYILVRWKPGADTSAAEQRFAATYAKKGYYVTTPLTSNEIAAIGELRSLPLALGIFFVLLAIATVAHALVTTVSRRSHDLAILRSIGFTRRNSRIAIAWQATLLAIVGLAVGVPLGILAGRLLWQELADNLPVVYVAPLTVVGLLIAIPAALITANLIAAGPAHAATRVRPAQVLRSE
jgi:hypothetical protein